MITAKLITEAYVFLRSNNHSIPDEVLDFMKDVSLAALQSQNSGKPIVSGSLQDFIDDVEYMQKLYSKQRYTQAEEWRDKLAEKLDDVMRLGGNDR